MLFVESRKNSHFLINTACSYVFIKLAVTCKTGNSRNKKILGLMVQYYPPATSGKDDKVVLPTWYYCCILYYNFIIN